MSEDNTIEFKRPIDEILKQELKSNRFLLAYFDEDGDLQFHMGEELTPTDVAFATDIVKTKVMCSVLFDVD